MPTIRAAFRGTKSHAQVRSTRLDSAAGIVRPAVKAPSKRLDIRVTHGLQRVRRQGGPASAPAVQHDLGIGIWYDLVYLEFQHAAWNRPRTGDMTGIIVFGLTDVDYDRRPVCCGQFCGQV